MPDESPILAMKANKGEWSEFYVFLTLLAEGKLYAADENLNRIPDIFYPILEIIRKETETEEYKYKTADGHKHTVCILLNGKCIADLPVAVFKNQANVLLKELQKAHKSAFSISQTEKFSSSIFVSKIKAGSTEKADIQLKLHDIYTGYKPEVGFSIKSDLGSAPTLLNASGATNFIYRIHSLAANEISGINAINTKSKVRDRLEAIFVRGGNLEFSKLENNIFADNLVMIDSNMHKIIAGLLLDYYSSDNRSCSDLTEDITTQNPLKLSSSLAENFYPHKIKDFLCAVALGMKPATAWAGQDEANGGYIIVKKDGDIVAYHIYNRDKFKTYLLDNTKFDTGGTDKHRFGILYEENNKIFIKLNLQIRFI